MGETVLRWDAAKLATEQDGDLGKARRTLDAILDFRGNMLFGTVTGKKAFKAAHKGSVQCPFSAAAS